MEWQVILVLVIGIPVILFPAAYVWYMNVGGIYVAIREKRTATRKVVEKHAVAR